MVKGKDFYGSTVTDAIAEACQEFSTSQDALNIDILETGSSGIFGLCRKKAHIRVAKKKVPQQTACTGSSCCRQDGKKSPQKSVQGAEAHQTSPELPTDEVLTEIQKDISTMLDLMGFPSTVTVTLKKYTVACHISDEYEEELVGREGRTLDSLQYLLRKITSRKLPDRIMLSLDVGTYRERRAEELKELALKLASQVREEGKTQAIPALNPSERRVVHMVLQEDKTIRSRSVGAGLFKKILIYKPGKKKPSSRKGKRTGKRGQQTKPASNAS